MKSLVVFSAMLAVATSYPVVKMWSLSELDAAISLKTEDPQLLPYLEKALNDIMLDLFTGKESAVMVSIPSPSGSTNWTLSELTAALMDPKTNPAYVSSMHAAASRIQNYELDAAPVLVAAKDISTWSVSDLREAAKSPSTKSELLPLVQNALVELLNANANGQKRDKAYIVTRVGLIPHKADYQFNAKANKTFTKKTKPGL